MQVSSSQSGPEKWRGSSACSPLAEDSLRVVPLNFFAACTARKAEPSAGPYVEAVIAAACALPSGVAASARARLSCAAALLGIAESADADNASNPVSSPNLRMKARRVGRPASQASI